MSDVYRERRRNDLREHLETVSDVDGVQQQTGQVTHRDGAPAHKRADCESTAQRANGQFVRSTYRNQATRATFPLQPVARKKIPLAIASFRASVRTVPTFSWNLASSCLAELNA